MTKSSKKRTFAERFLDTLTALSNGGDKPVSNKVLRAALGWEEERYWRVKNQLVEENQILVGKGPGGSLKLAKPHGRKALEVFISYSHVDEQLRDELIKHLEPLKRIGLLEAWHDRKIAAGEEWKASISTHLDSADVILLLVSIDFINSRYCYDIELERALERHDEQDALVIPVILRNCLWKHTPFGKLQALPRDAKAVMSWVDRDEAFTDVAEGIRNAVDRFLTRTVVPAEG